MTQSKFAVTGGIGSGKTAFCKIIKEFGYPVFSCDEIYAEILREEDYLQALQARFPNCFRGGNLDKAALAKHVFSSKEENDALNALAHPRVMRRLFELAAHERVFFAEVPLLFEGGFESMFDAVVAIRRNRSSRIAAVAVRDGLSEEAILARMVRQFDDTRYEEKHCIVVENDGSYEDLREQAAAVLRKLGLRE